MVRVPVKLYSATDPGRVPLREVHLADGAPIRHHRYCVAEDREVPYEEVAKGYEVGEDEYVVLEKEEIRAAAGERGKCVEIEEFVPADRIDPAYHDRTYYVGCREDDRAYAVLKAALEKTGRAGIGRFTFHNREYLTALDARGSVLTLHTLRFHDELVDPGRVRVAGPKRDPTKQELKLARRLVDSLSEPFEVEEYEDRYRAALMDLIEARAEGREIERPKAPEPGETRDLESALEASLA